MFVVGSRQTLGAVCDVLNVLSHSNYRGFKKLAKNTGLCPCRLSFLRSISSTSVNAAAGPSRITPQDVNNILRSNEGTREFPCGESAVRSYDYNQLASNSPIEDTKNEAIFLPRNGQLFGVFDGHAGGACAQVLAKRLFHYIASNLAAPKELESFSLTSNPLLKTLSDGFEFVDILRELYSRSYEAYNLKLRSKSECLAPQQALNDAFLAIDADMTREALQTYDNRRLSLKTLSVAMSGAVAAVAYIEDASVHVAATGDCQAVLGVLKHDKWHPKLLSVQHNADNTDEVQRILNEHPPSEKDSIIKYDRLFGQLAPLRAFGDVRYKWDKSLLTRVVVPHYGASVIVPEYHTPPYLTCQPHIVSHQLTTKDKFLILATDGLWDFITPHQAVRLVGEHMRGRTVLTPFSLPSPNMTLGEINQALLFRKESLAMRPADSNGSTHLIRSALSATEYGLDQGRLAQLLSLPEESARNFRDDMTVTVVYFDEEYLRHDMITSKQ